METNQKSRLKRNLIAAVLVIMAAWMIFLGVRIDKLEKSLVALQTQSVSPEDKEAYVLKDEQDTMSV